MSRESDVLAGLTSRPTSTSDVYERIGYPTLARLGLIPYPAFREALGELSAAGLAEQETAEDGSTMWWIADQAADRPPS